MDTMKKIFFSLLCAAVLTVAGCVSAGKLLDSAQNAWSRGEYAQAVDLALQSYSKALENNRKTEEQETARQFLVQNFPEANRRLNRIALNKLAGHNNDKIHAWEIYENLQDMNRRAAGSDAALFLDIENFSEELAASKEVACQVLYDKVQKQMEYNSRESCIKAVSVLDQIERIIPGYRDTGTLRQSCIKEATVIVALSSRRIQIKTLGGRIKIRPELTERLYENIKRHILSYDLPEYVRFIQTADAREAERENATLFIEIQGSVWIQSGIQDNYSRNGTLSWKRSCGGDAFLTVENLKDSRRAEASGGTVLDQEINIEFYPVKYATTQMTGEMYSRWFNNASWMDSQLNQAIQAAGEVNGYADMTVWAEMEYGGTARFLASAVITTPEGSQTAPINPAVWQETAEFINSALPDFLEFSDLDISNLILKEIHRGFSSNPRLNTLLENLSD